MKNTLEAVKEEKPVVRINQELNKYDGVVLFPEKVEQAKKDFAKYGMPDISKK